MKEVPENLIAISSEWEAVLNAITDPVSIRGNQFRIVKINPAPASLLNEKPVNLPGKKDHQVIHGTDNPVKSRPHKRAGEVLSEEVEFSSKGPKGADVDLNERFTDFYNRRTGR